MGIILNCMAAVGLGIYVLNLWYAREKAEMTKEEAEQEERDMGVW